MRLIALTAATVLLVGCDPYAAQERRTGTPTFSENDVRIMAQNECNTGHPSIEGVKRIRSILKSHGGEDVNEKDLYYAQKVGLCVEWILDPMNQQYLDSKKVYESLTGYDIVQLSGKKTWFKNKFSIEGVIVNRRSADTAAPIVEVTLDKVNYHYGQENGRSGVQSYYVDYSDHGVIPPNGTIEFKFGSKTEKGVNGYSLAWCIRGDHADAYNDYRYIESENLTCTRREQAREPVGDEKKGY